MKSRIASRSSFFMIFFSMAFFSVEAAVTKVSIKPFSFNLKAKELNVFIDNSQAVLSCIIQKRSDPILKKIIKTTPSLLEINQSAMDEPLNNYRFKASDTISLNIDTGALYKLLWCDLFITFKIKSNITGMEHEALISPYGINYWKNPSQQIENYFNDQVIISKQANGYEQLLIIGKNGENHQISIKEI